MEELSEDEMQFNDAIKIKNLQCVAPFWKFTINMLKIFMELYVNTYVRRLGFTKP